MEALEIPERHVPVTSKELESLLKTIVPEPFPSKVKKPIPAGAQATAFFINRDFSQFASLSEYDEVHPGILLGGANIAIDIGKLRKIGITHVLNAAQGQKFAQVDTTEAFYAHDKWNISFFGVEAMDVAKFKLSNHFEEAAAYIDSALKSNGKVYVHCFQGVSRSASLVLAYLMLYQDTPVREGVIQLRKKRAIYPNGGFLKQLCELNNKLFASTDTDGSDIKTENKEGTCE